MKEGEFFSEFVSFFKHSSSLKNFMALEDTEIAIVNAPTLQNLIDQNQNLQTEAEADNIPLKTTCIGKNSEKKIDETIDNPL